MKKTIFWILYCILIWVIISPYTLYDMNFIKGGDVTSFHIPATEYLIQSINQSNFPIWTEKLYAGFPIYAAGEMAFFSPLKLLLAKIIANPIILLKIETLIIYIIGSFFLYKLFEKDNKNLTQTIISHTIIFFGIPVVSRMLHINIIYAYYFIPVNLYLYKKFVETSLVKFNLFRAFSFFFIFSYGNYNGILLALIIEALYVLTDKMSSIIKKAKYAIYSGVLSLLIILPLLIPSYVAFTNAFRSTELNFKEGSYSVIAMFNSIYPFFLGTPTTYIGDKIEDQWQINETMFYFGIVSLFIALIVYLNKKSKYDYFFLISLYLFVILATSKYSPIDTLLNIFPINIFRYWGRSSLVLLASLGFIVSEFFNQDFKINISYKKFLYLIPLAVYIVVTYLNSINVHQNTAIIDTIKNGLLNGDIYFKYWLIISITALVLISAFLITKKQIFKNGLLILVIVDILLFSKVFINSQMQDYTNYKNKESQELLQKFEKQRIVIMDKNIVGNQPLMYPNWGIYGYIPAFEEQNYTKYLTTNGLNVRRAKSNSEIVNNLTFIESLGVKEIIGGNSSMTISSQDTLIKGNNIEINYLTKKEGEINVEVFSTGAQNIKLLLKQNANWVFKLNNDVIKPTKDTISPFYSLDINTGQNILEAKYVPKDLYLGLLLSLLLLPTTYLIIYTIEKRSVAR